MVQTAISKLIKQVITTATSSVFTGMKSLVNWPSNEKHKLPEYHGSEKDVFKVICDYFTNASSPLSTFSLYNILVEAFIRSEAADLTFRKSIELNGIENEDGFSLHSRDSARNLVLEMASPIHHKTSTPIGSFWQEKQRQSRYLVFSQESSPRYKCVCYNLC
jgi:hypothetical protein